MNPKPSRITLTNLLSSAMAKRAKKPLVLTTNKATIRRERRRRTDCEPSWSPAGRVKNAEAGRSMWRPQTIPSFFPLAFGCAITCKWRLGARLCCRHCDVRVGLWPCFGSIGDFLFWFFSGWCGCCFEFLFVERLIV